jgi:leucyl-tRNA synthetase
VDGVHRIKIKKLTLQNKFNAMVKSFEFDKIEKNWSDKWDEKSIYQTSLNSSKPKCYVLDMFPYPSGNSMHVGHPRGYVATDVYSRFKRMSGYNVLHPMGWDAFGLPAEETAIERQAHPATIVAENIKKFKEQLRLLGMDYDWNREVNTTDPNFYKQTQRIFLEFFRRDLAYNDMVTVNWCEGLGTVLANEDIVDGKSERGGYPVIQKPMRQWVLAITKYADRLIDDLSLLPKWPESVKSAQTQWIGRSNGHEIDFTINDSDAIRIFTTRIDTLFGVTFLVIAPENSIVEKIIPKAKNKSEILDYIELTKSKTDLERKASKTKTGVLIEGVFATNPINGKQIPIWIADYVLNAYGTGAIMAVPAHDESDKEFADVYSLPSIQVISEDNTLLNSNENNGLSISEAREKIATKVKAVSVKNFKIRDWVFSRQRFWGEPFPIVWIKGKDSYSIAKKGAMKSWLPENPIFYLDSSGEQFYALPVLPEYLDTVSLPKIESYKNSQNGEGPLADMPEWVNTFINLETGEVSNTGGNDSSKWIAAKRETNTMPQWAGSSWYYLRYTDSQNTEIPFSKDIADSWCPVNVYAGADHATAHLIYARFWHKVMYDAKMVSSIEPFDRLEFLGYILASDGTKISKRKGGDLRPDDIIAKVGADAFRLYEMFIGPFEKAIPWKEDGPVGTKRFVERVWKIGNRLSESDSVTTPNSKKSLHQTIKKVSEDIEAFKFNTAVAQMMTFLNVIEKETISRADFLLFIQVLAPFAPFVTEELWNQLTSNFSIHTSNWPVYDKNAIIDSQAEITIQVNGKIRGTLNTAKNATQQEVEAIALDMEIVKSKLDGKKIARVIYVPSRIINFVLAD